MNQPGWLAPAGNREALRGEFRVLRPLPSPACSHRAGEPVWRANPPGSRAPPRKRLGARALRVGTAALRPGRCAADAATGFEHPWRPGGRGARHPHLPLPGTAQLVEGAALIRRYRQVRSLGARLAGGATGWRSGLIYRRLRVRIPSGLPAERSLRVSKQAAGNRIRLPAPQALR
jgi:hypothetical protein